MSARRLVLLLGATGAAFWPAPEAGAVAVEYGPCAGAGAVTREAVGPSVAPGLDGEERHMLELVSAHRGALGLPTRHSVLLDAAADRYAARLAAAGNRLDHCLVGSPTTRAQADGFPAPVVRENLSAGGGDLAAEHFGRWLRSPVHRSAIELPGVGSAGVGHAGGLWVLLVSAGCPEPGVGCGWVDGAPAPASVSTAAGGAGPSAAAAGAKVRSARLRVTLRQSGRRLRLSAGVDRSARGELRIVLRRGSRQISQRTAATSLRTAVRLPRGRWRVTATFSGHAPWRSARAARVVSVP